MTTGTRPFSRNLRDLRSAKGMTLQRLADLTGTSKSYLCDLERRDNIRPSASLVHRLAIALETTYEVLLGYREANDSDAQNAVFMRKYTQLSQRNRARLQRIADVLE